MDAVIRQFSRKDRGVCYAFVRFRHRRIALKATEAMNGSSLKGRILQVQLAGFGWDKRRNRDFTTSTRCSTGEW